MAASSSSPMYDDNFTRKKKMNPLKIKAASKDPNSAGTADGPDEEDKGGDNDDADGDPPPIPHGAAISEFSNDPINGERKSKGRAPVPRSQ